MKETIVAVSTPVGEGGIGIVRLSGREALSIADRMFVSKDRLKPSRFKTYTTHYGRIVRGGYAVTGNRRPTMDDMIDEVILTVMKAPGSYTKEDVVEINCHGGTVPLRRVLELALKLGARLAEPGEFTKRAFLNGRIDLAQAEAVLDVIRSKTESSMRVAVSQLSGGLSRKIKQIKKEVLDALSEMEARIDFSEEDIKLSSKKNLLRKLTHILTEIRKLIAEAKKGIIFKEGIMCVICGKPNVGKSSLMNVFLKRNRVIVTPIPGTTRDAIEEEINLDGIPVKIVDTAGISAARGIVQSHTMQKSDSYIRAADLILFVLDLSKPWSKTDGDILGRIKGRNFMIIVNKSDLPKRLDLRRVRRIARKDNLIEVSLLKKKNLNAIEEAILGEIWHGRLPSPEGTFVTNLRHRKELEHACKCLKRAVRAMSEETFFKPEVVAADLRETALSLGLILGETVRPDILDGIFSKFCIGK